RIECHINDMGADLLTISGHKLGGPQGVGAVVRRSEAVHIGEPLIRGGGQERGLRAGTENVAAIAGFAAAAVAARKKWEAESARIEALRDRFEQELRQISPKAIIFGADVARLPNTTLFALPGVKAETALIALDLAGIAVSSGSACSSGKVAASHVLAAMAVDPALARGGIRVSLGAQTGERELDAFLKAWKRVADALSRGKPGLAA
ncbi:MAG: aminotransferase class V-fold PLP-dependent enzyme, partial [Proteobacteria bacterium]|nr:aminotransferase class V-fold PLP-dependent enzyme [Pseudomonadota bacterium]